MAIYSLILVALAALCLIDLRVFAAQQEQTFVHPLTDMPDPSEDVETSFVFPDHKDQKLPLGATVTVLCHFSNDGLTPLNISAIMGSLNHPMDFKYHIQNYTYKPFGIVVKGGEEITLEYEFQPHPDLEVAEYALAHTVFYHSDQEAFSSTFFNQVKSVSKSVSLIL